ncbi:hypothetical protein J6590_012798 [Homalodisca vitripennis]|nr:hypothetical protein J6590_012798 [Homalodisca vitripennis]
MTRYGAVARGDGGWSLLAEKPSMGVFLLRQDDDTVWSSRTMRRWLVEKPSMGVFLLRQDDDTVWSSRTRRRWLVVTRGNSHELNTSP